MRANSLQELVYKQGQAGVTKATVSIVFNNSDKANGPVEYQHLDQITVTRQVLPSQLTAKGLYEQFQGSGVKSQHAAIGASLYFCIQRCT